ncbi:MAG: formylglycine-generating enzyme family protein [Bacteroidetes bacterium]|nr:formylglycine-generating enzyme family protein [Bacteroidota bacterium]
MTKKRNIWIYPFILIGMLLILTNSCKKDDNNNPTGQIPVLTNIAMVNIPGGTFTMGSPTSEVDRYFDETQHQVTLSAFKMSKYVITNAQYAAFLNAKSIGSDGKYAAGAYPSQILIYASSGYYDWGLHYTGGQWVPVVGYENHPIIKVTWYGATEFATYSGGTLPTEAQWEYACRAGTTTPFNTGECLSNEQANYNWAFPYSTCSNTNTTFLRTTQAVGSYDPNAYGLYDMHGNVWEWCSDWYGTYPTIAQTNPTGALTGSFRVFRGGCWSNYALYCRSAYRDSYYPDGSYFRLGFRLVLPQ